MTELEINGILVQDSPGFVQVDAGTVQEVTVQEGTGPETIVWTSYVVVPRPITNLAATDNIPEEIIVTWTVPPDEGNPTDTLTVDIYVDDRLLERDVTSPYSHAVSNETHEYYVIQNGIEGTTQSNSAVGEAPYQGNTSPFDILTSGNYTAGIDFPANYTLTLCMCGGGGGGGTAFFSRSGVTSGGGGGGGSGAITRSVQLTHGQVINVTIGQGGLGLAGTVSSGLTGGTTSFGSLASAPGGGGAPGAPGDVIIPGGVAVNGGGNGGTSSTNPHPATNGGNSSGCGGSHTGALAGVNVGTMGGGGGGAGGFGTGGAGGANGTGYFGFDAPNNSGGGGGGRTTEIQTIKAGNGGSGRIRISWQSI